MESSDSTIHVQAYVGPEWVVVTTKVAEKSLKIVLVKRPVRPLEIDVRVHLLHIYRSGALNDKITECVNVLSDHLISVKT